MRLEHFKKTNDFGRFGFLYLFTLTEEIEIHKLIDIIYTNPKDTRECNKPGNVRLHPQVAVGQLMTVQIFINYLVKSLYIVPSMKVNYP